MSMMIHQVDFKSPDAAKLLVMLTNEWSDLTAFEEERDGLKVPKPLVVVLDEQLVGGAAFTAYKRPKGTDTVVWLNALYVLPSHRGRGLASQLIDAAIGVSPTLYALTDIPDLYTKLGWRVVVTDDNGSVVAKGDVVDPQADPQADLKS